jgi:hypothetical protein
MKTFLAVYNSSPGTLESWRALPEQERKEREARGFTAWGDWVKRNQDSIVDTGSPLGRTKSVSKRGLTDIRNQMGAYTIVRAESHEAAAKLFENHPYFMAFPGEAVEVMECLPLPNA